ncbi:MAG: hypothetical protein QXY70_01365 [Nanopusillaceae archaeon]
MNISDLLKDPQKLEEIFEKALKKRNKELAHLLIPYIKDLYLIYEYARKVVEGKVDDELEDIIAQDPEYSFYYALNVLKGPFLKGEDVIAKDPQYSYLYAFDVIGGPWPKGEDAIAQDPCWSFHYALNVIKGPWPKGEDAITQSAYFSYQYAKEVLNDRFKKGEDVIIKDRFHLDYYLDFLKSKGKLEEFYRDHPELKR